MNLVSGRKPTCLLHIPKTGGTYLRQLESGDPPALDGMISIGHTMIVERAEDVHTLKRPVGLHLERVVTMREMSGYHLFTCVRNHYDWLVSYLGHAAGWTARYANENHYDYQAARRGFDYLLKTIASREEDVWPNRDFIFRQLFTDRGRIAVDFIVRNERMNEDCEDLAAFAGTRYHVRRRQRVGIREDYRRYYNDELIDLVKSTWGSEMQLYGYDFDGLDERASRLGGLIAPQRRQPSAMRPDRSTAVFESEPA